MNSVLLTIGVAIVTALFAALAAPFFIDWNDYKSVLETRIEQATGLDVQLAGKIEGRILPIPRLEMLDVRVLGPEGDAERPVLVVPSIKASIPLTPLLKGLINITEIELLKPVLRLSVRENGSVIWGARVRRPALSPQDVLIDTLRVSDGAVVLTGGDGEESARFANVNFTGTAGSLAGPFKADGAAHYNGRLYDFRLGTGRTQDDGQTRVKLALAPVSGAFDFTFDGLASLEGGKPRLAGKASLGRLPLPDTEGRANAGGAGLVWRLTGEMEAGPDGAVLDKARLALGPEARAVTITGEVRAAFSPALRVEALATARQIDLDRAFTEGEEAARARAGIRQAGGAVLAALDVFKVLPEGSRVRFSADAAVINGGLAEQIEADVALKDGKLDIARMDLHLPGSSALASRGTLTFTGNGPVIELAGELSSRHLAALAEWAQIDAMRLGPLGLKRGAVAMQARGRLRADANGFSLTGMNATLDDAHLAGHLAYTRAGQDHGAGRFDAALKIDRIDFDRYVQIVPGPQAGENAAQEDSPPAWPGETRLELEIDAATIAGVGVQGARAEMSYAGGTLDIRALSVADLAGTGLNASGRIEDVLGQARGRIEARLVSPDLSGISGLIADLGFEGVERAALVRRAGLMSPAALEFSLEAGRSPGRPRLAGSLKGSLGPTRLEARGTLSGSLGAYRDGELDISVSANTPDSAVLLRQLGLAGPGGEAAAGALQPGEAVLRLKGVLNAGADVTLATRLLGASLDARGRWKLDEGSFSGELALQSADARTALAHAGVPGHGAKTALPVRAAAKADGRDGVWALKQIKGQAGANTFSGEMRLSRREGADLPRIEGSLALDSITLEWLSAALLGDSSVAMAGGEAAWPQGAFEARGLDALSGKLSIKASRVELGRGLNVREAAFAIGASGGTVTLEDFNGRMFAGTALGEARLTLRPQGIALRADMALADARIEDMAWAPNGAPVASGRLGLKTQIAGEGRSWLGLVSSLTGEGAFNLGAMSLRRLDPQAFFKIVRAADAGLELDDKRVLEVFRGYLDAGNFETQPASGVFTLSSGVLSARTIALGGSQARAQVSALIDLHTMALDTEWAFSPKDAAISAAGGGRSAAIPAVSVAFAGDIAAPERRLDVSALTGFLTVRRLEKDVKALEDAQADAIERERLDRLTVKYAQDHMRRVRAERERLQRETEAARLEAERNAAALNDAQQQKKQEQERKAREDAGRAAAARAGDAKAPDAASGSIDVRFKPLEPAGSDTGAGPGPDAGIGTGASGDAQRQQDEKRKDELEVLIKRALGENPPQPATYSAPAPMPVPLPTPPPSPPPSPPGASTQAPVLPPPIELKLAPGAARAAPQPSAPVPSRRAAPAVPVEREPAPLPVFSDPALPVP